MNIVEEYKSINSPEELLTFMDKYIKYGIYGTDNKVYINDGSYESNKIFQEASITKYGLANKDKVLKYGLGQCFDQTELERDWFKNHNYEFKTIFIWFLFDYENTYPTHSFLIYKDKGTNKYCWFEHADSINKGIHRYDTYEKALRDQMKKHIEYTKKMGNTVTDKEIKHIHIYEYVPPKYECTFYEYIDNILLSKEITDKIIKGDIYE